MRKTLAVAILAASTFLVASCAMPYDDPNYNASAGFGGADPSAAASDAAALEGSLVGPTSLGVQTPLTAAPAKGAAIVSILNSGSYDAIVGAAMDEAAEVLGWKHETVTVDSADPAAAVSAFDAAVARKPAGIHITGEFADALAASLPAAQTAGIPVICTGCSGDPAVGITDTSIDGTAQNTDWANVLATYVADSQYADESAGVQVFVLPGGALNDFNNVFDTKLVELCFTCSTTQSVVDPTFTALTDPASVAEFVVSEMSTSMGAWALLDSGALSGETADTLANDPTLLSPVVLIGRGASAGDIESLKALGGAAPAASTEAGASPEASTDTSAGRTPEQAAALQAWTALPLPVMGWRVIDQFARIIGGDALETGPLPSQLLTGGNAVDAIVDADGNYIGIADFKDQFRTLWLVK